MVDTDMLHSVNVNAWLRSCTKLAGQHYAKEAIMISRLPFYGLACDAEFVKPLLRSLHKGCLELLQLSQSRVPCGNGICK